MPGDEEADPIQEGVNHIEERDSRRGTYTRLFRNPRDKAGQGNPEEETCDGDGLLAPVVHSQAGSWQTEHHG